MTGFALNATGRGYLSAVVDFGECGEGYSEGRLFALDTTAHTAESIPVDFLPGKVLVAPDGDSGVVMGYRDEFGLAGNTPLGVVRVAEGTATISPLDDRVWDLQPASDGWIASAGAAGVFHVGLAAISSISSNESFCAAEAIGRWLVCDGNNVRLVSTTSGAEVVTLSFAGGPQHISGDSSATVVLHGTGISLVRSDMLEATYGMGSDFGQTAHVSGGFGFVSGIGSGRLIDIDAAESYEIDRFSDVIVADGKALFPFGETRRVLVTELDLVDTTLIYAPPGSGHIEQVEFLPDGSVIFASTVSANSLHEGDYFDQVFTPYDAATDTWGEPWGLVVE